MLKNELNIHLLSLLIEHEQGTGYELTKLMSNSRIWRASHQQIYKSLKKLAKNGILVCKHEPQEGKPDRKVYSLTSEGINQFNKAVENINPSMKSLHSIRTVMLNVGNDTYFVDLQVKIKAEIQKLELLIKKEELPCERIAMTRELYILRAEEMYCLDALAFLSSNQAMVA
ncbi:PadR family transcriptional regulator [Vibrio anguillarum]|uniref:PadR family transcriptional regulator n=3 Tax=Vibrio anguillarum TaxID=55601 RepID=UPI000BB4C671|nr:PadR family transcriptional regulator [Vibrio anguillarum]ATC60142.1 hypothetical protein CMV05_22335 [Vibrio anguillarum]MBF4341258.1 PadR family transcriptional regulator [Vibrio anguillarum]